MMNETAAITATAAQIISTPHCWYDRRIISDEYSDAGDFSD
jgi:hypothetical protein